MLFFNKKNSNDYQEVLKILREVQLKQGNLDVKMQELESKYDFMKAEIKLQRKKKLGITEEQQDTQDTQTINNSMFLPDNGAIFKHK